MTVFRPDDHTSHEPTGPTGPTDPAEEAGRRQVRLTMTIYVAAMAGALVIFGIVLSFISTDLSTPEWWMLAAVGGLTVAAWLAVLGIRPQRAQGTPLPQRAMATLILRVALLEAPAIVGLVLFFVSQPFNLLVYLLPALFSLAGIWLFARPGKVLDEVSRAS